ncbi:MAG: DUF418 domain-containing protein [Corynebacterium sp.]|nr:DUF418 domain-containing protein [Corynebacterium sp.]
MMTPRPDSVSDPTGNPYASAPAPAVAGTGTPPPAPTTPSTSIRYIAPDLARGLALLGIALANIPTAWVSSEGADLGGFFGGIFGEASIWESIAVLFHAMFIHVRGLPLFTTLLGFGVGLITMSLWRRGFPPGSARKVLWRRYGVLAIIGVLHLVFIFFGDIIVQYSLLALILIAMITLKDRTLMIIAWVLLGIVVVGSLVGGVGVSFFPEFADVPSMYGVSEYTSYLDYVTFNAMALGASVASIPIVAVMLGPLMIIGFVWARRGVLTDVETHRRMLTGWVIVGAAVVLLIGLPWGLAALGILPAEWELPLIIMNTGVGLLTGPAALALVALLFPGTSDTLNPGLRAFVALGRRSMSGYILQSILLVFITQPFALNFGASQGILPLMALGFGVWLITLIWAYVWDLLGWPGPIEWIHRRLSYGRDGLPAAYRAKELTAS